MSGIESHSSFKVSTEISPVKTVAVLEEIRGIKLLRIKCFSIFFLVFGVCDGCLSEYYHLSVILKKLRDVTNEVCTRDDFLLCA